MTCNPLQSVSHPSNLREFLRSLNIKPKKGLSQNFLIDRNIVRKILAVAAIEPGDPVLEIGPGPGALTEALLEAGATVYAVEKDSVFATALQRFSNVRVFNEDIRQFDFSQLPRRSKVVSNLPYHLTAPILGLLAPRHDLFTTVTVMVQEEVARRMIAQSKTANYGSLSLFLQFYSKVCYAFKVSRHCFYPAPKVDSAIVTLTLQAPPAVDPDSFFAMVHKAFQHRRKMIKTTLGTEVSEILISMNEKIEARPEELPLETFLKIYRDLEI